MAGGELAGNKEDIHSDLNRA